MMPHDSSSPAPQISETPTASQAPRTSRGGMAFLGIALAVIVLGGGFLTMRAALETHTTPVDGAEESVPPDGEYPADYRQWSKPLFAIVLTGQMHGYIDPCGCSYPQQGGLSRRYNFVQSLKSKKWDVVGIDLGELPQIVGGSQAHAIREQNLLKYELSAKALQVMGYKAMGIGRHEILMPLGDALTHIWDQKSIYPRPLLLTLSEAAPGKRYFEHLNARQYEIFEIAGRKVGVINMMGPELRVELKGREDFLSNVDELPKALQAFADAGVEFGVILHHENPKSKFDKGTIQHLKDVDSERERQAKLCAEFCKAARERNPKIPPIQLMMTLTEDAEPPTFMKDLGDGLPGVVEIGHKGKYVGLVGVYQNKGQFRLQYQKVMMSPEWETAKGNEKDNRVTQLMERYNQVLKEQNMLDKAVRSPHPNQTAPNAQGLTATFVGSGKCLSCHKEAAKVWKASRHKIGTDTLEELKHPSGRQYDPECIRCHVTGFAHPGGYNDPIANLAQWKPGKKAPVAAEVLEAHNLRLRGIGCESCHGPGSEHIKIVEDRDPTPAERLAINPYRPTDAERQLEGIAKKTPAQQAQFDQLFRTRMEHLNRFCIQCHDSENDVHWNDKGVVAKWIDGGIIHRTTAPKNNDGAKAPPALKGGEPPPIVIEVVDEKKK